VSAGTALHRELFATPRAAEFFELRSLQAQTGQPADKLDAVVVKELLDNALDAAESLDGQPEIALTISDDGESVVITVTDNGPGMAPVLIDQVLDFSVLVSDKAASGYSSDRTSLVACCWPDPEEACTIRGRSASFSPGSPATPIVWTTSSGSGGLRGSSARGAVTPAAGPSPTGATSAPVAEFERR